MTPSPVANPVVDTSLKGQVLRSLFSLFFGAQRLQWYEQLDWATECTALADPAVVYPDYYTRPNFHGIEGGYLNAIAAVTYDRVTAIASPPNEGYVRQQLIKAIVGQPQHILDLGCGTGSSTILLKQAFPDAEVVGIELSPWILAVAHRRAAQAGVELDLRHGLAEMTGLAAESFDWVTASFLFHEMPVARSRQVLTEAMRLLKPGGRVLVLDGNQSKLRQMHWLIDLFREPYSKVYAAEQTEDWLKEAGFEGVEARSTGWIQQLNWASKPRSAKPCS